MEVVQAINERRSVNFFDPQRDIAPQRLRELIDLANLAPSSMNLQPWRVIVVRDPARKKALRRCAFDQPKVEEASAVLIMVADPAAVEKNLEQVLSSWLELGFLQPEMKAVYIETARNLYGEPDSRAREMFAVKNTALFAMNLMLAAEGLGLQTHPMDGIDPDLIKQEFNIPTAMMIPMLVAVGYLRPQATLLPRAFRRTCDEFVRFE